MLFTSRHGVFDGNSPDDNLYVRRLVVCDGRVFVQALQEEVRGRVAQLAALGAECDRLAPLQPPATSHTLRLELTRLGGATAHLRAETHSRHDELGEGAREASGERGGKTGGKTGGLEEYQREVGDLQRWVEQTKGALKVAPPDAEVAAEAARQQEKLREVRDAGGCREREGEMRDGGV